MRSNGAELARTLRVGAQRSKRGRCARCAQARAGSVQILLVKRVNARQSLHCALQVFRIRWLYSLLLSQELVVY